MAIRNFPNERSVGRQYYTYTNVKKLLFARYIRNVVREELTSTAATFVAAVDPGTRISFLFARCRYLSIFRVLLLTT